MESLREIKFSSSFIPVSQTNSSPFKQRKRNVSTMQDGRIDEIFNASKVLKKDTSETPDVSYLPEKVEYISFDTRELNLVLEFQEFHVKNQIAMMSYSTEYFKSSPTKKDEIHRLMYDICCNQWLSWHAKYAELGVLHYYIASNKNVILAPGLLESRIKEIESEIFRMKEIHQNECPEVLRELLPSGCTAYILRVFVRMIFPHDGSFNAGGCQAVLHMMNSRLALYMSEECRLQIIKVVNRLMIDVQFLNKCMELFEIKKEFEELILIDMKLPKDEPFSIIYVRWAMLMVLFNPLSQSNEPNCFAISVVSNLINDQRNCHLLLDLLKNTLISGQVSFQGALIPAMPLFKSRLIYENELNSDLPYKNLEKMTIFSVAESCLSHLQACEHPELTSNNINSSLKSKFGADAEYAKQVFFSFKNVLLQELVLSIFQFSLINALKPAHIPKDKDKRSVKEQLLHLIKVQTLTQMSTEKKFRESGEFIKFKEDLYLELSKIIYFVDFKNSTVQFDQNRAVFEHHEIGFNCTRDKKEYTNFRLERRACIFEDDKLIPIDSLSSLQYVLYKVSKEIGMRNSTLKSEWMISYLSLIQSEDFKKCLAKVVYIINEDEAKLTLDDYFDSNSFFLIQDGGHTETIAYLEPFNSIYLPEVVIRSKSAGSLFNELINKISNYVIMNFWLWKTEDVWTLISTRDHAFNLPIANVKQYLTFGMKNVNKNIIDPAKNCGILNQVKIKRILDLTFKNGYLKDFYEIYRNKRSITKFVVDIKKTIDKKCYTDFENTVEQVLNEISVKNLKSNLTALLFRINGPGYYFTYENRINELLDQSVYSEYITPLALATIVQKSLLECSPSLHISLDVLENEIRSFYSLPEVVKVANLNWKKSKKFKYLYLEYSYVEKGLVFNERNGSIDAGFSTKFTEFLLEETTLRFSK